MRKKPQEFSRPLRSRRRDAEGREDKGKILTTDYTDYTDGNDGKTRQGAQQEQDEDVKPQGTEEHGEEGAKGDLTRTSPNPA